MEGGQLVAIEEFPGLRVIGIGGTGASPAGPDFVPRLLQDRLVGGVLPLHQLLDQAKKAARAPGPATQAASVNSSGASATSPGHLGGPHDASAGA